MQTSNSSTTAFSAESLSDITASHFDDPLRLAKEFLTAHHLRPEDNKPTLYHHREDWVAWNGLAWSPVDEKVLRANVSTFIAARLKDAAATTGKKPVRMSTKLVNSTLDFLQSLCILDKDREFFSRLDEPHGRADRNYITFLNGVLNIPDYLLGKPTAFAPHTPDWFSPTHLDYPFDPEATCPQWSGFLQQVLGDEDPQLVDLMQELFGYCLTPDTSHEKFFLLSGSGRNGKSTIINTLSSTVGDRNVSHVSLESFQDKFALVGTVGKLVNSMTEVTKVTAGVEGLFKAFVSADPIAVRNLYEKVHSFKPTARCVFAANALPAIKDHSDGFWRRLVLIPFKFQISEEAKDTTLFSKLQRELPGIALWALRGLERLRRQGHFTLPVPCLSALHQYRDLGNPLGTFLKENFVFDTTAEEIPLKNIYELYEECVLKEDTTLSKPSQAEVIAELTRLFPMCGIIRKIPMGGDKKTRFVRGVTQQSS